MTLTNYKVIKTDFDHLEELLNNLYKYYPQYHIYQILPEHSYDGALAVVILANHLLVMVANFMKKRWVRISEIWQLFKL